MKKFGLVLVLALVVFACSACTLSLTVNTDGDSDKQAESVEKEMTHIENSEKESNENNTDANATTEDDSKPFYGVWCFGGKSESDAENFASELTDLGYEAQVFVTTDWENLNSEKFYVVTAGVCETEQEAEALLSDVKRNGYSDAYVKYTGERNYKQ